MAAVWREAVLPLQLERYKPLELPSVASNLKTSSTLAYEPSGSAKQDPRGVSREVEKSTEHYSRCRGGPLLLDFEYVPRSRAFDAPSCRSLAQLTCLRSRPMTVQDDEKLLKVRGGVQSCCQAVDTAMAELGVQALSVHVTSQQQGIMSYSGGVGGAEDVFTVDAFSDLLSVDDNGCIWESQVFQFTALQDDRQVAVNELVAKLNELLSCV